MSTPNHLSDLPDPSALWKSADLLRGSVDAAEYKHLVLGLLFLKYVSESFEQHRQALAAELSDPGNPDYIADEAERQAQIEDRDEYAGSNVFFVPEGARWSRESDDPAQLGLLQAASLPDIGQRIDNAFELIEKENETLKNILPKIYARAPLSAERLGQLVETIGNIPFESPKEARDYLGRAYEYFISRFAAAEGKGAGEFYTPQSVTQLLVEMLEPYEGRIFDPACGSCGLFIQSARFLEAHGRTPDQLAIYGQEMNLATWRLGQMNLAVHGLGGTIRYTERGSLLDDAFANQKMDFVLANPPFNQDPWGSASVKDDVRWKYGLPPDANANYAWMQHLLHHLAPTGRAGYVMANGSLTTRDNGEHLIREKLVEDDAVDCIVELPNKLFFSTQIPVCLWFLDRVKHRDGGRDRTGKVLFIDARKLGTMISRTQRVFTEDDIARIAGAYHSWRGETHQLYEDVPGFSKEATLSEIEAQGGFLAPGAFTAERHIEEEHLSPAAKLEHLADVLGDRVYRFRQTVEDDIANNLFRSWFVDFDPVSSADKLARTGLNEQLLELFGEALGDTEAGAAPLDWEIVDVYALCDVVYGASLSSSLFNEDGLGLPLLRIRDIGPDDPKVFTPEEHPKQTLITRGDIVCGMDGEFRVQRWRGPDATLNQRVCHFRPSEGVPSVYLAAALKRPISYFERSKTGTTVIHLLKRDIDKMRFARPPQPLLDTFDQEVERQTRLVLASAAAALDVEPSTDVRQRLMQTGPSGG